MLGISGTMTGSSQYATGRVTGSATLADNGILVNQTYSQPLCPWAAPTVAAGSEAWMNPETMSYPSTFTGSVFVHAGPNALPGTYNVVPLVFAKFSAWGSPPRSLFPYRLLYV